MFRLARSGLAVRGAGDLAAAAACPASDFARDAALLALAARADGVTRDAYDAAVVDGELVLAHVIRGAIHALAPGDLALYGRALIARAVDVARRAARPQVRRLAAEHGFAPSDALDEVATATKDALSIRRPLDKNELHEQLRQRVSPTCCPRAGAERHHVVPMLWRFPTVKAGARLDSHRRFAAASRAAHRPRSAPSAASRFYGPATPGDFADWAGLAKPHAQRLWDEVAGDLGEVRVGNRKAWLLRDDAGALESPPAAAGIRLVPPGDPYLQKPNRPLLDPAARCASACSGPSPSPERC